MLSMFKNKKGFSVLFHGEEEARQSDQVTESSVLPRPSAQLRDSAARPNGSGVAQYPCQRCSKRFSALESDDETEAAYQCYRCQYPTCPQCREPAAGCPPWVCCVCSGFKSMMWLLERTRAGPMLVTRIVEFCDPRGQRLMRSMFRFTLQQYHSPTPRLSITLAGRASDGHAGSGPPSSSRPASQTPSACPTPRTWTSSRLSGERSSVRLSQVPASFSNVRRPSSCTHPKRASLLRSVRQSHSDAALAFDAGTGAGAEDAIKENSPAVERGVRGSEVLRRIEEAVGVVEYSPESTWRTPCDADTEAENSDEPLSLLPDGGARFSLLEDRCTAVANIYSAGTPHMSSVGSTLRAVVVESEAPSPHARPSGHAAFQREALQPQLASTNCTTTPTEGESVVLPATAALAPEASWRRLTPPQEPCRLGHSVSPTSSGSGRSASPAPRFPTFGQFLDEHVGMSAGDTHLPRDSNVLVTVSPETENSDEDSGGVIELGGGRCVDRLAATGGKANEGLHTPRGVQPQTPLSTGGGGSSGFRGGRRTSGLSEFTPTRVLDMSSARVTLHRRSSSRRRTTRGSLQEIQAPHLYGESSAKTSAAGNARRSGQMHESPYMYDLPTQFGSHGKPAGPANGQLRRQNAPLATRTAGRALGSDGRQRLVRQHSRTVAPPQRTASRNNALQRMPSRNGALARTNSSFAHLTRTASSHGYGPSFARTNSTTAHALASTPAERAHLTGGVVGCGRLQRTDSVKLTGIGAGYGAAARAAPQRTAVLECTHLGYGTPPAAAGASSLYSSPLKRTLSSLSPLKRTTSNVCLRSDGSAPFGRRQYASGLSRSVTTNIGFARTSSATASGGGAPSRHAPRTFGRTATGTDLYQFSRGRIYEGPRCRPVPTFLASSAAVCGRGRGAPSIYHRVVGTSPVRGTPTAARTTTPTMGRRRFPTSTVFSRTGTGTRNFERQHSNVLREPAYRSGGVVRRTVDPAPTLVGATRRKAVGSGLHRTPSATGAANGAAVTPRTPRRYIIASVSTASTPVAVNGGESHSVLRPVLSSVASSSKPRSSHDSNASGGTAGYSSYTGSAHAESEKAGVVEPGIGQTSGQRCRPLVGATTVKEKAPLHVATLNRRAAAASASAAATAPRRTGRAAQASPFARQNSRLNF